MARLRASSRNGLTLAEVAARREQCGPNELPTQQERTLWRLIRDQFRETVIWVLLAAILVSAAVGEFLDAAVILAIVLLNAFMGVLQERKAEQSLAALRRRAAPTARLVRDGVPLEVPASEVVPGDILLLQAGDCVPADARLLEAADLRLDEASLTGESLPVEKEAAAILTPETPLADRRNLVYMGVPVTHGRARAVAVATGAATELGHIAALLGTVQAEKTPLQQRLEELGRWLGLVALGVCGVVFAVGLLRGMPPFELFLTSVSLAVAAIPEGLPAVVTIVLALGVQHMVRHHAIVRHLRAVEALGSVTVICTDKTGTLTENKMSVRRIFVDGVTGTVTGEGYAPDGEFLWDGEAGPNDLRTLLEVAVLCNDARLVEREGVWQVIGDPTEGALLAAAAKAGLRREALEAELPRRAEIPFDPDRKRMSTVHAHGGGVRVSVKGAPALLLSQCTRWQQEGEIILLLPADRERILRENTAFADESLRVLGFAYRDLEAMPLSLDAGTVESDLVFVGLVGMLDPPRPEARAAVARCSGAGIRPVMVTGDNPVTAAAVARELDMSPESGIILTGDKLQDLSDEALTEKLDRVAVFARVAPADKLRIVQAYQDTGEVVAMTGDGVNDAPALKRADIGVAMGITGTDVAREAASIVLTDDNFASIVAVVEEGRAIFANIRKVVYYLLSCNISEVMTIFLAILAGLPHPLLPVQLLWVNLVTDGLPALALGVDPKEHGLMDRRPRDARMGVVDPVVRQNTIWYGGCITLVTLWAFIHGLYWYHLYPRGYETFSEAVGALFHLPFWRGIDLRGPRTLALTTLAFAQLAHSFNCRSDTRSLFAPGWRPNLHLIGAVGVSFLAQLAVVYLPPLQHAFGTVPIVGRELAVLVGLSLTPLFLGEARKTWLRRRQSR